MINPSINIINSSINIINPPINTTNPFMNIFTKGFYNIKFRWIMIIKWITPKAFRFCLISINKLMATNTTIEMMVSILV